MSLNDDNIKIVKERRFKVSLSLKSILYILLIIFVILMLILTLSKKWIVIKLIEGKDDLEVKVFAVLIGLMLMFYLVACGLSFSLKRNKWKFIGLIIVLYVLYLGYTNVGIYIEINRNFGLLKYKFYQSNSSKGIKFFILNFIPFWISFYFITLLIESEG